MFHKPGQHREPGIMQHRGPSEVTQLELQTRRQAASLLLVGALCGLAGIIIAAVLGLHRVYMSKVHNLNGNELPSGQLYFPACISEMVYDPDSPSGKAFLAFMVIAAICLLSSWYPYRLCNVFVGPTARPTDICCHFRLFPTWNDLREFVPPIGLLLVALIQSTPEGLMGFRENIAEQIHANGAMAMIGGHCIFEFHALTFGEHVHFKKCERFIRWTLSILSLVFGVSFAVACQLFSRSADLGICCKDVWLLPNHTNWQLARGNNHYGVAVEDQHRHEILKKMLYDSASGWALVFKYMEFWCEVLSVLFFVAGLLAIWWFCPERKIEHQMGMLADLGHTGLEDSQSEEEYSDEY